MLPYKLRRKINNSEKTNKRNSAPTTLIKGLWEQAAASIPGLTTLHDWTSFNIPMGKHHRSGRLSVARPNFPCTLQMFLTGLYLHWSTLRGTARLPDYRSNTITSILLPKDTYTAFSLEIACQLGRAWCYLRTPGLAAFSAYSRYSPKQKYAATLTEHHLHPPLIATTT